MPSSVIIAETVVITANTITIQNPALPRLNDAPSPAAHFEVKGTHSRQIDILLHNDEGGLWTLGSAEFTPMSGCEAVSYDLDLHGLPHGIHTLEVCESGESMSRKLEL